jgi:hypothetical protein
MEGCLYKKHDTNNYYLVDSVASYFIIVIDLETFKQQFIQKESFETDYELIKLNSTTIIELLYNYEQFQNEIDVSNFKDFNFIVFNQQKHYIREWKDVYDFIINSN